MIEQQAQVVSVADGKAVVRIGANSGCAACDAGRGCGAGVFGRLLRRSPLVLELENPVGAHAGQPVVVGLPERLFLRLAARFYLTPLLCGLAGAAVGYYAATILQTGPGVTDALTLTGGLTAAWLVFLRLRSNGSEFPGTSAVHVLRVVEIPDPEQ
ncbi:MAG: SoxR reducing system RseC family protein [Planctomycetes bacterium]|nr:SoxR reducing system RseC family protein [Planctomycetota bacterium]